MNPHQSELDAEGNESNQSEVQGTLLTHCVVKLVGVAPNIVITKEMVVSMNHDVLLLVANLFRIMPDLAKEAGAKAAGQCKAISNQINNVMAFRIFCGNWKAL